MYHSNVTSPTQSSVLEGLNPRQREAVEYTEGPLLILAGPGSGKTRVIAHRIAYLVREKNVRPRRILAVTFTNKAAREMRDRVFSLVGEDLGRDITLGTFHAVCSRILRIDGEQIGVPRTFTIYDDSDQIAAVKRALEDQGVDPRRIAPRAVLSAISHAKSELQGPREFAAIVADYFQEVTSRVFLRYQDLLEQNSALDFDDILLKTVELFNEREEVLEKYADRYLYVHIDEFQDTNIAQYVLAKQWRLSPPQHLRRRRPRSVDLLLALAPTSATSSTSSTTSPTPASSSSSRTTARPRPSSTPRTRSSPLNKQRKEKNLWTENGTGGPVVIHEAYDQEDEAVFVVEEIKRLSKDDGLAYHDIAVMYRTNAQSRPVEEALVAARHPLPPRRRHPLLRAPRGQGPPRLPARPPEPLRLRQPDAHHQRPGRGIGDKTLSEINRLARERTVPPYAILQMIADSERDRPEYGLDLAAESEHTPDSARPAPSPVRAEARRSSGGHHVPLAPRTDHPFQKRTVGALMRFLGLLNELIVLSKTASPLRAPRRHHRQHRLQATTSCPTRDGEERWENVQQLRIVAAQYDELKPEHALASLPRGRRAHHRRRRVRRKGRLRHPHHAPRRQGPRVPRRLHDRHGGGHPPAHPLASKPATRPRSRRSGASATSA